MLVKQIYGAYWAVGGKQEDIWDRWLSLFNWGAINGELIEISDTFKYFLIEEDNYLFYRATAFANNWKNWWIKTHNGKMIWKLSKLKAKKEFEAIKLENFLSSTETFENNEFSFGWLPESLESVNLDKINFDKWVTHGKTGEKIEFNKNEFTKQQE